MTWLGLHSRLQAVARTAFPSLRVIGMAYTGLIGMGAAALVVSVAFLPVAPVLQQATQPAREAVANLVQPAADVVTSLISSRPAPPAPRLPFVPGPEIALASPPTVDETVPDDIAPPIANLQPVAARVAPPQVTLAPAAKVSVSRNADGDTSDPVAEDVPVVEPQQVVETRDRAPVRPVVVAPTASPAQQEASAEAPQTLAPQPAPTAAPWQTKARLDVENQAAIDAAKASVVRRKADADTANQAAIDVLKSATETAEPARPLTAVAQTTTATAPVTPPTTVTNQALIDAARASTVRARADANAANQAAIDAARAPRSTVRPTPSPTMLPAPATPTPAPRTEPTPTSAAVKAADPVSVAILDDQPVDFEEMPVTLALDKTSDISR